MHDNTRDSAGFPEAVKDACGVGLLADIQGRPSHALLAQALDALARMAHRGAIDADGRTGDGAGVMTQIPFALLRPLAEAMGLVCAPDELAVGLVFLPRGDVASEAARRMVELTLKHHGLPGCRWRAVPIDEVALGRTALQSRPAIAHALVPRPRDLLPAEFETRLIAARRAIELRAHYYAGDHSIPDASVSSTESGKASTVIGWMAP